MPATVKIMRWTGASGSPTKTDITGTTNRAATADDPNPGTNNPIPVPTGSGTNYSFWVVTRLSATVAAAVSITNIKWYTDGTNSLGTGVSLNVSRSTDYVQATGTVGTSGNVLTSANYSSNLSPTAAVNAFQYTSSSPLSVNGSIGATTGDFGDFVIYQVAVVSTAGPGITTAETITWQYDET